MKICVKSDIKSCYECREVFNIFGNCGTHTFANDILLEDGLRHSNERWENHDEHPPSPPELSNIVNKLLAAGRSSVQAGVWTTILRRLSKLYAVTLKGSYPLPKMDKCVDCIGEAEWFTKLTRTKCLADGYS